MILENEEAKWVVSAGVKRDRTRVRIGAKFLNLSIQPIICYTAKEWEPVKRVRVFITNQT